MVVIIIIGGIIAWIGVGEFFCPVAGAIKNEGYSKAFPVGMFAHASTINLPGDPNTFPELFISNKPSIVVFKVCFIFVTQVFTCFIFRAVFYLFYSSTNNNFRCFPYYLLYPFG